jgi:hypothetical protein
MTLRSEAYRAYAVLCEQRALDEIDPVAKREWEQAAIDWHQMAHSAADDDSVLAQIDRPDEADGKGL